MIIIIVTRVLFPLEIRILLVDFFIFSCGQASNHFKPNRDWALHWVRRGFTAFHLTFYLIYLLSFCLRQSSSRVSMRIMQRRTARWSGGLRRPSYVIVTIVSESKFLVECRDIKFLNNQSSSRRFQFLPLRAQQDLFHVISYSFRIKRERCIEWYVHQVISVCLFVFFFQFVPLPPSDSFRIFVVFVQCVRPIWCEHPIQSKKERKKEKKIRARRRAGKSSFSHSFEQSSYLTLMEPAVR